jgi:hypothetical protein
VKITKRQLKRIIREEKKRLVTEYGNPSPPRNSNWYEFAKAVDIGTLDLDEIAYDLGFADFYDMDISISPKSLASRDTGRFVTAVKDHSLRAEDMDGREILAIATGI